MQCFISFQYYTHIKNECYRLLTVCIVYSERRSHSAEEEIHTGGDGSGPDGAQPVQRETDGAAGGREVDGDDPVNVTPH